MYLVDMGSPAEKHIVVYPLLEGTNLCPRPNAADPTPEAICSKMSEGEMISGFKTTSRVQQT